MRTLVTGGSGFIGRHVLSALSHAGHHVVNADIGQEMPGINRHVDILDRATMTKVLKDDGIDAVFHLAAAADVNLFDQDAPRSVMLNVDGTARVLAASLDAGVKRFYLASTVWVYGATARGTGAGEWSSFEPRLTSHPYMATKIAAECLCGAYQQWKGLPACCLRYGIPYGPGMRDNLVIAIFARKIAAGEAITVAGDPNDIQRYFIYVSDLAEAHARALEHDMASVLNLEGSRTISLAEIITSLEQILDKKAVVEQKEARAGDFKAPPVFTDVTTAALGGWRPTTTFEDGLKETIAWMKIAGKI